jgi:acyl-CoA synthetase (AMP-forming)/AMP-acid ligase II
VRIVAPDGSEVPNGERGEIVVQGPGVMKGYIDAGLLQPAVDDDGWLHTGDIGERDDAGCLRVVDRLKDMIIVGGFNAYPAEIENIILRRPDVVAVAVVGIADERLGEVPCAVLVPADRESFDSQDFDRWLRESMSNFKVPRKVILADALPTNASGKVDKLRLRADVAELR